MPAQNARYLEYTRADRSESPFNIESSSRVQPAADKIYTNLITILDTFPPMRRVTITSQWPRPFICHT